MMSTNPTKSLKRKPSDDPTKSLGFDDDRVFNHECDCIRCGEPGSKKRKVTSTKNGMSKMKKIIISSLKEFSQLYEAITL